jgi:hypothetical protein
MPQAQHQRDSISETNVELFKKKKKKKEQKQLMSNVKNTCNKNVKGSLQLRQRRDCGSGKLTGSSQT